jgi:hypothetical protein
MPNKNYRQEAKRGRGRGLICYLRTIIAPGQYEYDLVRVDAQTAYNYPGLYTPADVDVSRCFEKLRVQESRLGTPRFTSPTGRTAAPCPIQNIPLRTEVGRAIAESFRAAPIRIGDSYNYTIQDLRSASKARGI